MKLRRLALVFLSLLWGHHGLSLRSYSAELFTLTSGEAIIDYDQSAWEAIGADLGAPSPVMKLDTFFDSEDVFAKDYEGILRGTGGEPIYLNQVYLMTGPLVTNLSARTAQPTDFRFDLINPSTHTGKIGLGGITRFNVSSGGHLLFGDFTLQYDVTRVRRGGSGWYLRGNIPPMAPAFDLLDPAVLVSLLDQELRIEGKLGVTFELANFLFGTPSDTLRVVGNIRFHGRFGEIIPYAIKTVNWAFTQDGKSFVISAQGGKPSGGFRLLRSATLKSGDTSWVSAGEGVCDADGRCSAMVEFNPVAQAVFYRWEGIGW